jgi:hypothetical protein
MALKTCTSAIFSTSVSFQTLQYFLKCTAYGEKGIKRWQEREREKVIRGRKKEKKRKEGNKVKRRRKDINKRINKQYETKTNYQLNACLGHSFRKEWGAPRPSSHVGMLQAGRCGPKGSSSGSRTNVADSFRNVAGRHESTWWGPSEKIIPAVLNVLNVILQYNAIQTLRTMRRPDDLRTSKGRNIGRGNKIHHLGDSVMDTRTILKWVSLGSIDALN